MSIVINPGTGPIDGAAYAKAVTNVHHFMADVKEAGGGIGDIVEVKLPDHGDGRYRFFVSVKDRWHEVLMPGLPLTEVRWMDEPGQNIWDFPRLYIDGSSWIWQIAIRVIARDDDDDD